MTGTTVHEIGKMQLQSVHNVGILRYLHFGFIKVKKCYFNSMCHHIIRLEERTIKKKIQMWKLNSNNLCLRVRHWHMFYFKY